MASQGLTSKKASSQPTPFGPGSKQRKPIWGGQVVPLPGVLTVGVNAITATSANLIGSVNPNGSDTHYWFVYGPTTLFGTATFSTDIGSGTIPVTVTAEITGLTAGSTYYFAVVGQSAGGQVTAFPLSFTSVASQVVTNPNQPIIPFGSPTVDIPHFGFPFTLTTKGVKVVEQDTVDEIFSNVQAIVNCQPGECPEIPAFGVPDPTFGQIPLNPSLLTAAIQIWEPRATEDAVLGAISDSGQQQLTLTTSTTASPGQ